MQEINKKLIEAIQWKKALIWDFDWVFCFLDWHYGEGVNVYKNRLWQLLEEFDPKIRSKFSNGLNYPYEHTGYIIKRYGSEAFNKINTFYLKKELQIFTHSSFNDELIHVFRDLTQDFEHYIWSNNQGEVILKALTKSGIHDKFKAIASRDKIRLAKPNVQGFDLIKSYTSNPIKSFLFIGDSQQTDTLAAKKLGMEFFFYKVHL